jgi:ornithine racemase
MIQTPRIEIDLHKLMQNINILKPLLLSKGINICAITKAVCGNPDVANVMTGCGIKILGDSRIENIKRMKENGIKARFMLIRSPIPSRTGEVVHLCDISLNSEISVIKSLANHALDQGKMHDIILMVEMGDRREGIMPRDIGFFVREILKLKSLRLIGIGANLACFGGVKPDISKMSDVSRIASEIENEFNIRLKIISGGNSANFNWFFSTDDVGRINNLRLGESILLGCETLERKKISGLHTDVFTLVAEIIEAKEKPSLPEGEICQNSSGIVPQFKDRGIFRRLILGLGTQDVAVSGLKSRTGLEILGAGSDHIILHSGAEKLKTGDEIRFDMDYKALSSAMASKYIKKVTIDSNCHVLK